MNTKTELAYKLQLKEKECRSDMAPRCFVGFDGFTDEILKAVESRSNAQSFQSFSHIADFGKRIIDAAGKSGNIELVRQQTKIGGNAPILTNALLKGGHHITFAGAIGTSENIEPLFQEMAQQCKEVIPLCPSAHSDAIEFNDGKVILGKLDNLDKVHYDTLLAHIGQENLIRKLDETDLFISVNWTMLPMMTDIWKRLLEEVVPHFTSNRTHWMFVDLADPAKRSNGDILEALDTLRELSKPYRVILGLNEAEATRIAHTLSITTSDIETMAKEIYTHTKLYRIVVHATKFAVSADADSVIRVEGFFCPTPVLTTGAGDNFNAGFCNALLYQLTPEEMLLSGVATSGYYVAHGKSPTIPELAKFLNEWRS